MWEDKECDGEFNINSNGRNGSMDSHLETDDDDKLLQNLYFSSNIIRVSRG
jgi:hypothetical protein